jgi:putative membrane protein
MAILLNLIVSTIAVLITAYIIPGVHLESFFVAVVVAVVLAVINAVIRPVVSLLTLPINLMTLGLFSFVITALMVLLTAMIVPGFEINGFVTALLFGIVLSIINWVLFSMSPVKK